MERMVSLGRAVTATIVVGVMALTPAWALADSGFAGIGSPFGGKTPSTGTAATSTASKTIELPRASFSMHAGDIRHVVPVLTGIGADEELTYTSSDEAIAYATDGYVYAGQKGTATVTVALKSDPSVKATCEVTILNSAIDNLDGEPFGSEHDYLPDCTDTWRYDNPLASSIKLTFDSRTEVEENYDFIVITNDEGSWGMQATGTELAGKVIEVEGDAVTVGLITDEAVQAWGFEVTSIEPQITDGWHEFLGDRYYYEGNKPVTGKKTIDGVEYEFDENGMVTGETQTGPVDVSSMGVAASISGTKVVMKTTGAIGAKATNVAFELVGADMGLGTWVQPTKGSDGIWTAEYDLTAYPNGTFTVKCWASGGGDATVVASANVQSKIHPAPDFSSVTCNAIMEGETLKMSIVGGVVRDITNAAFHVYGHGIDVWLNGTRDTWEGNHGNIDVAWIGELGMSHYPNGDYSIEIWATTLGGTDCTGMSSITSDACAFTTIPNVIGMPYSDAISCLAEGGFGHNDYWYETAFTEGASTVFDQYPAAGTSVNKGSSVDLSIWWY